LTGGGGREQLDKGSDDQLPFLWTELFDIIFEKLLETSGTDPRESIILCVRIPGLVGLRSFPRTIMILTLTNARAKQIEQSSQECLQRFEIDRKELDEASKRRDKRCR
jgi:hypothetical protein